MSGKAKNLRSRVCSHFSNNSTRSAKTGIPPEYLFRFLAGLRDGTDGIPVGMRGDQATLAGL